ncbi:MAG: Gfo/Idh/MocA family oxidoreductase [Rhodoferax sp.]|nr:Gfo/Idh/MocA family oxidoreductase [Rhodoferax sp.]
MTRKIRYGIIGCGSMGREHIENIKMLDGTEVTAIADPDSDSRAAASALLPGPARVFESYAELLTADLCDALVIATPNFTHIDVLRAALQTDAHILIEKPLCTRVDDCLELVQRANGRKSMVWVAQEYRYMPPVAEMLRMTHAGAVGRVHQVAIREHREPFYPKVADWNRFSANTGGTLVEKCCHYFNLMDLVLQENPLSVYASGAQRVNHLDESYGGRTPDILDSAYVILEYPSGARAMLDLCMFAENSVDNEQITVVGDKGKLESLLPSMTLRYGLREDWGTRKVWGQSASSGKGVSVRRVWDTSIKYMGNHFGASYVEHARFVNAIRQELPAEVTLEQGLRSVAAGIAAHRSIETRRVVAMAEVLPAGW